VKSIGYKGTVAGYREFARRELLKAAFMGQTLTHDAAKIQRRLDRAAAQDRTRRILEQAKKGGDIA